MKFVIQRVTEASVKVEENVIGQIGKGFLVLIGVGQTDTEEVADKLVKKMIGLRIFEDENGKTNLSLADVNGALLLISQFTLYANCKKGNRPSFTESGAPDMAEHLYEYIIAKCKQLDINPEVVQNKGDLIAFLTDSEKIEDLFAKWKIELFGKRLKEIKAR